LQDTADFISGTPGLQRFRNQFPPELHQMILVEILESLEPGLGLGCEFT
jgi:hypothetical protein